MPDICLILTFVYESIVDMSTNSSASGGGDASVIESDTGVTFRLPRGETSEDVRHTTPPQEKDGEPTARGGHDSTVEGGGDPKKGHP